LRPPVCIKNLIPEREMIALVCFCLRSFTLPFKSKIRLGVENSIVDDSVELGDKWLDVTGSGLRE
jgi:hypothetical protein